MFEKKFFEKEGNEMLIFRFLNPFLIKMINNTYKKKKT